jgi:hypothetical protein
VSSAPVIKFDKIMVVLEMHSRVIVIHLFFNGDYGNANSESKYSNALTQQVAIQYTALAISLLKQILCNMVTVKYQRKNLKPVLE